MMMSELSGDLVEEILCRVPATSLKRLRSTCKRWNHYLFSDSRFTRKHFEKAAKQFCVLMLKELRVCSMRVKLHGIPYVQVTCELSLIDPCSSLAQKPLAVCEVFHCDGLLLCLDGEESVLVVWNPFTGQTKWIQPRNVDKLCHYYALGSYQDNKSGNKSYKILGCGDDDQEYEIYEINYSSWRTLDVTPNWQFLYNDFAASLKGKTYWVASEENEKQLFILSFDYTTEIFERLAGQIPIVMGDQIVALSVVREEKLAVLVKPKLKSSYLRLNASIITSSNLPCSEIWLTNMIDETNAVTWSKVLTVDLNPDFENSLHVSFLFYEEKNVLIVCCAQFNWENIVLIVGEDNRVRKVHLGEEYAQPFLFYCVPSLIQI